MAIAFLVCLGIFVVFFTLAILNMVDFACKIQSGKAFKEKTNNFSYHMLFAGIAGLSFFGMLITGIIWLIQRFT